MQKLVPHNIQRFGSNAGDSMDWMRSFINSNRFTLSGALLVGIFIPELFHPYVADSLNWGNLVEHGFEPTLIAAMVASVMAHVSLRRIGVLPLVDDKLLILPTLAFWYSLIFVIMTFVFRSYALYHLTSSFIAGIFWYYSVALLRARLNVPRLAVVGNIRIDEDLRLSRVEWVPIDRPEIPGAVMGIAFDSGEELSPDWERFFGRVVLQNIPVYDIGHLREMMTGRLRLRSRPELVFGTLLPSQPYLRIKGVIDFLGAVLALVPAVPVIAVAGLLVRLETPGPVLFRQTRMGYQGKTFTCYKLRTMRMEVAGPAFTSEADPRITKVGGFLRRTRIDELPQLLNILRGEMSWIGPRPEAASLSDEYRREIPYYDYRHVVRPGITGWAAVHQGNVAQTDAATRKLEYDFYYIKYFSVWLDLLIVLMTLRTVVTGFGAR